MYIPLWFDQSNGISKVSCEKIKPEVAIHEIRVFIFLKIELLLEL